MNLLTVSLGCFILAILSAIIGFAVPAWDTQAVIESIKMSFSYPEIFKVSFVVFIVLFLVTLVAGLLSRP